MTATMLRRMIAPAMAAALLAAPAMLSAQGTARIQVTARVVAPEATPLPGAGQSDAAARARLAGAQEAPPSSTRYRVVVRLLGAAVDSTGAPLQVWVRDAAGREQRLDAGAGVAVANAVTADTVHGIRAAIRVASSTGASFDPQGVALAYEVGSLSPLAQ